MSIRDLEIARARATQNPRSKFLPAFADAVPLDMPVARAYAPLLEPARYKGAKGGRGAGRSHNFADLLIDMMLQRKRRALCLREVQKSLDQSVKQLIEDKIRQRRLTHYFKPMEASIRGPHGGRIVFQGMQNHNADSVKSLEAFDIAWVEEAHRLSQRSLDLLRPTIRAPGSELWFSWNCETPDAPVDKLLVGANAVSNSIVVHTTYMDNPWVTDELLLEAEYDRRSDLDKYNHVWLGQYLQRSKATVFLRVRVGTYEEIEEIRKTVPPMYGVDFGFAQDPTVLLRGHYVPGKPTDTLYITGEAWKIGCEIDHTPALFNNAMPEAKDHVIRADGARPETISYLQRHGFPRIEAAKKGAGSIVEGVEFLRALQIVICPTCVHTQTEFTHYKYKTHPLTGDVLPELPDAKNHTIDAARYMIERIRRGRRGVF